MTWIELKGKMEKYNYTNDVVKLKQIIISGRYITYAICKGRVRVLIINKSQYDKLIKEGYEFEREVY